MPPPPAAVLVEAAVVGRAATIVWSQTWTEPLSKLRRYRQLLGRLLQDRALLIADCRGQCGRRRCERRSGASPWPLQIAMSRVCRSGRGRGEGCRAWCPWRQQPRHTSCRSRLAASAPRPLKQQLAPSAAACSLRREPSAAYPSRRGTGWTCYDRKRLGSDISKFSVKGALRVKTCGFTHTHTHSPGRAVPLFLYPERQAQRPPRNSLRMRGCRGHPGVAFKNTSRRIGHPTSP